MPSLENLTYIYTFTKPTTCENRVSRGCFVLGGS